MHNTTSYTIFTPLYIVDKILNDIEYTGDTILSTKIMEPSFGEGAFIFRIITRIIQQAREKGLSNQEISVIIRNNVYGIEKDQELHSKTLKELSSWLNNLHIVCDMSKNLICADTLDIYSDYKNKFDFVVGNPPYRCIQNCDEDTRKNIRALPYCGGNTDMYIAFYSVGLYMLNDCGKLGYITPNSWLKNSSQRMFRNDIAINSWLKSYSVIKYNIWDDIMTYPSICILDKNGVKKSNIYIYDSPDKFKKYVVLSGFISKEMKDLPWCFDTPDNLKRIYAKNSARTDDKYYIQHGVSTNCNKVYVSKVYKNNMKKDQIKTIGDLYSSNTIYFNGYEIEPGLLRPCIKASKCNAELYEFIIFPYIYQEDKFCLISEDVLKSDYPLTYKYLCANRDLLDKRNMEKGSPWYAYARSQGFKNMREKKLVFQHIIKNDDSSVPTVIVDSNCIVYSGMYAVSKNEENSLEQLRKIINSKEFKKHCCNMGHEKGSGYIAINGNTVNSFYAELEV
jgi:adenine-specific DNA-methyltransferase